MIKPWESAPWTPRKWQMDALPKIGQALREGRRGIVSACTGAGKSILLSEIVYQMARRAGDEEVIVVATPTQALVVQLAKTIRARFGDESTRGAVGVFYGRKKQAGIGRRVIVCCNPSSVNLHVELAAQGRRVRLLVADECHGTEAAILKDAIPMMAPRWAIGFTATPFRSAEHESLTLWDSLIYRYGLGDALRDGVLVPWRVVNWDGSGDDPDTDRVCVDLIRKHGRGPGIVSARSIEDAEDYAQVLTDSGIPALAIHSRLERAEQEKRLSDLLAGDLRCLVHVALLTEGVDIPPLRWLCMRRPVTARVRFVQELGRVLRVSEAKTEAVIMDPHDLFGLHGIMHAPAIGEGGEDESGMEQMDQADRDRDGVGLGEEKVMPPAKALDVTTQWARRVLMEMQLSGLAEDCAVEPGSWRTRRPSDAQVRTLGRMSRAFARFLPENIQGAVRSLAREQTARRLQRGAVSDLISILMVVANSSPNGGWQARTGWSMEWPEGFGVEGLSDAAIAGMVKAGGLQ